MSRRTGGAQPPARPQPGAAPLPSSCSGPHLARKLPLADDQGPPKPKTKSAAKNEKRKQKKVQEQAAAGQSGAAAPQPSQQGGAGDGVAGAAAAMQGLSLGGGGEAAGACALRHLLRALEGALPCRLRVDVRLWFRAQHPVGTHTLAVHACAVRPSCVWALRNSTTGSPSPLAAQCCTAGEAPSIEKQVRALKKKIRQAADLAAKRAEGKALSPEEEAKLAKLGAW